MLCKLLRFKVATMPWAWIANVWYSFSPSWGYVEIDSCPTWEPWSEKRILSSGLSCLSGQQGALLPFISNKGCPFQDSRGKPKLMSHHYLPSHSVQIRHFAKNSIIYWWAQLTSHPGKHLGNSTTLKVKYPFFFLFKIFCPEYELPGGRADTFQSFKLLYRR